MANIAAWIQDAGAGFMMTGGKKSTAASIVYGALEDIQQKLKDEDPLAVFSRAVENIKPKLEVWDFQHSIPI